MEAKDVVYMKGGVGEDSYRQNSILTQKVTSLTRPQVQSAVEVLLFSKPLCESGILNIADLGCAAGPNTYSFIATVKETVAKKCKELHCKTPEIVFYLNDLPGNDFNSLFRGLSEDDDGNADGISYFVMGVPGSFHGRLFPRNSVHVVHSSYGVHWLSQAPKVPPAMNKGKIYISKTSPEVVREAYLAQFQQDFTSFLRSRSEEVVSEGIMILMLDGRRSPDPATSPSIDKWERLAKAISELVSQGLIDDGKLDSFNVPYYIPSQSEVRDMVENEGSFAVQHIEMIKTAILSKEDYEFHASVEKYTKSIRCFTESMISEQFGEQVVDKIYEALARVVALDWGSMETFEAETIIVLLQKI